MRTEIKLTEYAPAGSDIYYVLRQVLPNKEYPYLAVHALNIEWTKISEAYKEAHIAQQKLAWWHEEIKRMYQGAATHPITQILSTSIETYAWQELEFLALLEANILTLQTQIFDTEASLRQHYQHTGGIVAQLKAKVLVAERSELSPKIIQAVHQLGIAREILRHLLHFPKFLQRQHLYLPLSLFQTYQLDPQAILRGENLARLPPLLQSEFISAQTLFNTTLTQINKTEKNILRPLILETKLKLIQVKKIANHAWQIFNYRLELSPIVKFLYTEFTR